MWFWQKERRITVGLVILVIGVIFLLRNLGIITQPVWSVMWPSILIVIGIVLIFRTVIRIRKKRE